MLKVKSLRPPPFLMEMSSRPSLLSPDGFRSSPPTLGSGIKKNLPYWEVVEKENPTMGIERKENLKSVTLNPPLKKKGV